MLLFIPFLALDNKEGVKVSFMSVIYVLIWACIACIALMSFFHSVLNSCDRCKDYVVWKLCNVCYSVLSCWIWVWSKEFLLVCDILELCDYLFFYVCFSWAGYSGLQAGFSGFPVRSFRAPTRSPRVLLPNTHFSVWISCHMHHTLVLHSHAHPTVYQIRASMFLPRFMPIVDVSSQIWNSKFMAYLKGELLYASRLSLYDYQMSYMWVVINHQKRGD